MLSQIYPWPGITAEYMLLLDTLYAERGCENVLVLDLLYTCMCVKCLDHWLPRSSHWSVTPTLTSWPAELSFGVGSAEWTGSYSIHFNTTFVGGETLKYRAAVRCETLVSVISPALLVLPVLLQ